MSERARIAKAARPRPGDATTPLGAPKLTLASLARRWLALSDEIDTLDEQLEELVAAAAPSLAACKGIGTETASMLLAAAGDNPDRLRRERSFAAVCGSSPVDASSGPKNATASTAAATDKPTAPSTSSS